MPHIEKAKDKVAHGSKAQQLLEKEAQNDNDSTRHEALNADRPRKLERSSSFKQNGAFSLARSESEQTMDKDALSAGRMGEIDWFNLSEVKKIGIKVCKKSACTGLAAFHIRKPRHG
jgi:hypothetical protein